MSLAWFKDIRFKIANSNGISKIEFVTGPMVDYLALEGAVGYLLVVKGDVDEMWRELLGHEGDVIETHRPGLYLGPNRGLGSGHHQLKGALTGLAGVHGEGEGLAHWLGGLQAGHSHLLGVVDVAGVGGPTYMLLVGAGYPEKF